MKNIALLLICILLVIQIHSQPVKIINSNILSLSESVNIFYSPTALISNISFAAKEIAEGKAAIEFTFITSRKDIPPRVNINSIALKSSDNKTLTLTKPYHDTIYYNNHGGLCLSTIHLLEKNDVIFMKEKIIATIILIVNEIPLQLRMVRKSQQAIKKIANKSY